MALFWQLSGPESHLKRHWTDKKHGTVADDLFNALSMKFEDGRAGLDLILGIEQSGASQILLPYAWRYTACRHLSWRSVDAFPSSKYASLSPMHIDTSLRLQMLLEERQNISKVTKASKKKGDTSKANARFWNGPPNLARAAFEHGRSLWRILQNELQPQSYGLPDAPWCKDVTICSLALNFWAPDGVRLTTKLIDASVTKPITQPCPGGESQTWYFAAKENKGLQNSFQTESTIISGAWNANTLPQGDIGPQLQDLLITELQLMGNLMAPLILLVHDYDTVKQHLEILGIATSKWVYDIKQLLGFQNTRYIKLEGEYNSFRDRSRSPPDPSTTHSPPRPRRHASPGHISYAPVYVVDTVVLFKTMTGSGEHPRHIRPVSVYNKLMDKDKQDTWCAGDDSNYILQSWKRMVQGPCIEEQRLFHEENMQSTSYSAHSDVTGTEAPEADGLYQPQQNAYDDAFNDSQDSDEEW